MVIPWHFDIYKLIYKKVHGIAHYTVLFKKKHGITMVS